MPEATGEEARMYLEHAQDSESVEKTVDRAVRTAVNEVWGKKPACHVQVVEV